jgi:L-ornithine Nalpha-acyltransferase
MHTHATAQSSIAFSLAAPEQHSRNASEYQVRLALPEEWDDVFKLRYDIFFSEMGAQLCKSPSDLFAPQRDVDRFDELCDHMVVTYCKEIIGTYRLLNAKTLKKAGLPFYSESEFQIEGCRALYGDGLLELGRSCVRAEHRSGIVPRLLWAGIAQYMILHNVKALFGCVSVHDISELQALRLRDALAQAGHWTDKLHLHCAVQETFQVSKETQEAFHQDIPMVPSDPLRLLPPLMKGYLNLGAKICGGPAVDSDFGTKDYLVLLDAENISPKYYRAFVQPMVQRNLVGTL